MRANSVYSYAFVGSTHMFNFPDCGTISVDESKLIPTVSAKAKTYGVKVVLERATALGKDEHGKSATPMEKFQAMKKRADALIRGEWTSERDNSAADAALLTKAFRRLVGFSKDPDAVVAKMTPDEVKVMLTAKKLVKIIADIKAEAIPEDTAKKAGDILDELLKKAA